MLEFEEFRVLVDDCRTVWKARGRVSYVQEESEKDNLVFRRSLDAVADIGPGEVLTKAKFRRIRPGYGLATKQFDSLLGSKARSTIRRGTPMGWGLGE